MTTEATTAAPHISNIRTIMAEQLRALRSASPAELESELKRSKAVSELSQTMINSAKVEIDYLALTKQSSSAFLQINTKSSSPATPAPAPLGVVRNNADEEKPKVTRTNWVGMVEK